MNTSERNMIKELVALGSIMDNMQMEESFDKSIFNTLIEKQSYIYKTLDYLGNEFCKYQTQVENNWKSFESIKNIIKREHNIK